MFYIQRRFFLSIEIVFIQRNNFVFKENVDIQKNSLHSEKTWNTNFKLSMTVGFCHVNLISTNKTEAMIKD